MNIIKLSQRIGESIVGKKVNAVQAPSSGVTTTAHPTGDYVFFVIRPFRDNDRGVNHWDTIIKNLVSIKGKKIQFRISGNHSHITMYVQIPKEYATYFQNTFYANYPSSDLIILDTLPTRAATKYIHYPDSAKLLSKMEFTKDGSYMDPITDIFSLYNNVHKDHHLDICFSYTFQLSETFRQKTWKKVKNIRNNITTNKEKKDANPKSGTDQSGTVKADVSKPEIFMSVGFATQGVDAISLQGLEKDISSAFSPFANDGKLEIKPKEYFVAMTFAQAVNFFHIPTQTNFVKGLEYTLYKKLPYPTNIPTLENTPHDEITILGTTDYRAEKVSFGIKKEDKFRHVYIVGKTGTGKSTFISNMVKSDMNAGNGLALLDPHGDLVETVLEHIPSHRINDVILFDVADTNYPIGFNLLQYENDDEKNRIVSGVVSTFYKLFAHSRGPRLEYILRNVLLSIVEYPNATLMHILRILVDQGFRDEVISHVTDALVLKFWHNEFNKRDPRQREEAIAPITNKIGQFLSSSVVRNIFGQPRTKLNLRKAMDEGKIILINLSKGKIGEDNAAMIGSLLVTKFQIDAMSRADVSYNQRRDFYLYIDEFQNFATTSFAVILSEARKYKLSLIVANQFTNQLLPEVKDAIFGNIGTIISFTLGADDAGIMSSQFKEIVSVNDLISLPKFTAYSKLMIDGITSDPFSMKTMPLSTPEGSVELREKILKQSRQRYAIEKGELESLMHAWNMKTFSAQEKIVAKAELESLGLSEQEADNIQHPFVDANKYLFDDYTIEGETPDAIIFDTRHKKHKAIRYSRIDKIIAQSNFVRNIGSIAIYQHRFIKDGSNEPLMILIGMKQDIIQMIEQSASILKFVPNLTKLKQAKPSVQSTQQNTNKTTNTIVATGAFSIKDITLGEEYVGYVKLLYNYGIFVTVKGVEGLLHKNYIKAPTGVDWKKYYNIGDKIKVIAKEFKDIKGEKRVVWSMQ